MAITATAQGPCRQVTWRVAFGAAGGETKPRPAKRTESLIETHGTSSDSELCDDSCGARSREFRPQAAESGGNSRPRDVCLHARLGLDGGLQPSVHLLLQREAERAHGGRGCLRRGRGLVAVRLGTGGQPGRVNLMGGEPMLRFGLIKRLSALREAVARCRWASRSTSE